MRTFKSFLIIHPHGIGDVLFTTPLVSSLKAQYPSARIYFLSNKRTQPLLVAHPHIKKVFPYERDEFEALRKHSKRAWIKAFYDLVWEMKKEKIDACFDLSMHNLFGFLAFAAGIPVRVGFRYKRRGFFLNKTVSFNGFREKHVIEYYLSLLEKIECPITHREPELFLAEHGRTYGVEYLKSIGFDGNKPLVVIAPGGGASWGQDAYRKQWPKNHWIDLIDTLSDRGIQLALMGGPEEVDLLDAVYRSFKNKDTVALLSPGSLIHAAALIAHADVFVGNDGGLLHMAHALKRKCIGIYGPVDEHIYGLYPENLDQYVHIKHDCQCRPCYKNFRLPECEHAMKCLHDITVDEVINAIYTLLNKGF